MLTYICYKKIKHFHFMEGNIFNHIAKDYHSKRRKPWRPLEFFLNYLKKKEYLLRGMSLDLGCANGRNFKILGNYPRKLVGVDISLEFLKIAHNDLKNSEKYLKSESNFIQVLLADINYLPIRKNSIQNIFSIATIHHIRHKSNRKKLLSQFNSILQTDGNLLITVWRKWQKKYRGYFFLDGIKRSFSFKHKKQQEIDGLSQFGDKYIPWTLSVENKRFKRFYHFFSKREIKNLLKDFTIKEFNIMGGPSNNDNFFILAQKKIINGIQSS
ncbi:MAG: class I SAM-dependent methyltransferase [Candidatus Lokiarchaeota archaeon]|nr:class I SAM-dependent methyltransferase [Candidatus Lokiarchaeota archaeon]